jgi:hypothetical protein
MANEPSQKTLSRKKPTPEDGKNTKRTIVFILALVLAAILAVPPFAAAIPRKTRTVHPTDPTET